MDYIKLPIQCPAKVNRYGSKVQIKQIFVSEL
jgi:hypothetical protein